MTRNVGTTPLWRDVLQQFAHWQTLEEPAREPWLAGMQQRRPDLHRRLQAMIRADGDAEDQGFLNDGAITQLTAADLDSRRRGTPLGPWVLDKPIARGGMGHVWLALRGDGLYSGRAAVKLLNALNAGPEAGLRFAREAQFLGRLAHPHIAQLFDAGLTADGARYLIMEYVEGAQLDQACDQRQASVEERLQLFLQVCAAVAYAHGQQIIHRDLKPANILVTREGRVKLLDFGVAKLLDEDADGAGLTRADCGWFTLEYAAPEQLLHAPLTTATDVYALGVLLFNLLCGGNPHRKRATLSEAILHHAEPALTLRASLQRGDAAAIAVQRRTSIARLQRTLGGELDTIVSKALDAGPSERYDTVDALAADVRRYLQCEPLHARPQHWFYRARKFVQRNRLQTSAAGAVVASLLLGAIFAVWQWQAALQETQRTRAAVDALTGVFDRLTPERSPTAQVPIKQLLRQSWRELSRDTAADRQLQAAIARPLGIALVNVGEYAAGAEALATSRKQMHASGDTRTKEYLEVVFNLGFAHYRLGHSNQAKTLFAEVAHRAENWSQRLATPVFAQMWLGDIARSEGKLQLAKQELSRAVAAAKERFGEHSHEYQVTSGELARLARETGDSAPSGATTRTAPATASQTSEDQLRERVEQATRLIERGQYVAAATQLQTLSPAMQTLYGTGVSDSIFPQVWLSMALFYSGRVAESDTAMGHAIAWARRIELPDVRQHVEVVWSRQLLRSNRRAQAAPLIHSTLAYFEARGSAGRVFAERARASLGELRLRNGEIVAALAVLGQTRANQAALFGGPHRDMVGVAALLAIATDIGEGATRSTELYEQHLQLAHRFLPSGHPEVLKAQLYLDYARWRAQRTAAQQMSLRSAAQRYAGAIADRRDAASVRALTQRLDDTTDPASARVNLLALLDH